MNLLLISLTFNFRGHYVGIHASGFRDFLLKSELLRSIVDCGFEQPSEVQHECIPRALLGMDVICQAKSGMGKTAVFVLATLHQLTPTEGESHVLVLGNTRELAFQIAREYERFSKYLPDTRVSVFFGGIPIQKNKQEIRTGCPHVVVGSPGRILALAREKALDLSKIKHFILDECDELLGPTGMIEFRCLWLFHFVNLDMRSQVQQIFMMTPHEKQVMMFSATMPAEVRPVAQRFTQNVRELLLIS